MRAQENRFRTDRVEGLRFRSAGVDAETLVERLVAQGGRGALVGPKGSGKTTLLLELAAVLRGRGLEARVVRLNSEGRRLNWSLLRRMDSKTALLLDGAEQLRMWSWWRVAWMARGVACFVTTSHTRAHLPLLHRHATSVALLRGLVEALLGGDTCGVELDRLYARHGGNVRMCLRELYDREARGGGEGSRSAAEVADPSVELLTLDEVEGGEGFPGQPLE